jgi:glycine/D-amino acid oxidase-like deaminating enzyme
MGALIAFHLAQRKPGSIIVLDKHYVGHGASGRSSARPCSNNGERWWVRRVTFAGSVSHGSFIQMKVSVRS